MSDFRKAKVLLTAVYKSGEILKQDHSVPARISVLPIPGADDFRELSVRMVITPDIAEELLEGICLGSASISIEQMLSPIERDSQS